MGVESARVELVRSAAPPTPPKRHSHLKKVPNEKTLDLVVRAGAVHKNKRAVAVIVEVAVPVVARYSQTKSTEQSRYPE